MLYKIWLTKTPLRKLPAILLVSFFLFFAFPIIAGSSQSNFFQVRADIGGLVAKINQYRSSQGLPRLKQDQKLVNAACWLAKDHATHGSSGHIDSLGREMSERLSAFGIGGTIGENVARWTDKTKPATRAFELWKSSPGHNSIMLNSAYTRIGVGSAYGSGWQHFVANFANGANNTLTNQCGVKVGTTPTSPQDPPVSTTGNNSNSNQSKIAAQSKQKKKPQEAVVLSETASEAEKARVREALANAKKLEQETQNPSTNLVVGLALLLLATIPAVTIWWFHKQRRLKS